MRAWTKLLLTAALVVPMAMTVVGAGGDMAVAAGGTSCSRASGTASFTPALPVSGSTQKVKPTITVNNAKLGGCKGGGVTSGTFNSTIKFHSATNCKILLSGKSPTNPPTGTIKTTWNTGKSSTAAVTLHTVAGQPTQTHVTGKITAGLFKGDSLSATLQFAPKKGDCISTPLKSVTFSLVTNLKIS